MKNKLTHKLTLMALENEIKAKRNEIMHFMENKILKSRKFSDN